MLVAGAKESSDGELRARIAQLEAALSAERACTAVERARADALELERDKLRASFERLKIDLELLRRRIFVAKAERIDTNQLELEFAEKKKELDALAERLEDEPKPPPDKPDQPPRKKPKGRRNVSSLPLVEERYELLDHTLEGKAKRIGFEESYQLGWRKGGAVKIVIARAKYRVLSEDGSSTLTVAPLPRRAFARCLAAPSLLAKIATDKYADGLPLYRQEQRLAREGLRLDRGTMGRWMEDLGGTVGSVVNAMRDEALKTAFCIATDATGIAVQPEASDGKGRRPCKRGHFFVMLADRDHVLFEYTAHETSQVVARMFKGFSGYVQADAKSVYDVLFRDPRQRPPDDKDESIRHEVGCWAHARRKFYEAALFKDVVAREALFRIRRLFTLEESWAGLPPSTRTARRRQHASPEVDSFLEWAEAHYERVKHTRGLLRSALGYVVRQKSALRGYLDDGRLRIDNNASERALRTVAVGRKAWLFVGSDDHADATANLFSLIASCRLHGLDPETYLRDLIRVLPHWPIARYLELAPRYWQLTRNTLDPRELELPLGDLTLPPTKQEPPPG